MKFFVLLGQSDGSLPSLDLVSLLDSLSSKSGFSDQSLDFGGFMSVIVGVSFALESSSDGVLFDQSARGLESLFSFNFFDAVEFSNARGSLGSESSGLHVIGKSGDVFFSLLDHAEGKACNIGANNASSNGSSLSLSFSLGTVSLGSWSEEKSDSVVGEYTLFHGKSVLIESSVDFENVALELFAEGISLNFLTHSLLEEDSASVVIIDIEALGSTVYGMRNAELG